MLLKVFIVFFCSLSAGSLLAAEATIPPEKAVIQFESKLGTVTFAHQKHADLSITQCTTCHHKAEAADTEMKSCHECHAHESTDPQKASKVFHTRCTGCHQYTVEGGQHAGPLKTKCKLCHVK